MKNRMLRPFNRLTFERGFDRRSAVALGVRPQSSGTLEVTADTKPTGDGNFGPALAIHRADTGELLACGNDTAATVTQRAPASAGTPYLIAVMSAGSPGDFRMHWEVK